MPEIRLATEDEQAVFGTAFAAALGEDWGPVEVEAFLSYVDDDRAWIAVDDGQVVGTTGAFGSELTLPGRVTVPAAAVTGVGVLPTHRRKRIGTAFMEAQFAEAREREEPVAVLDASEATIYGRFGYGAAVYASTLRIDTSRADFAAPSPIEGRYLLLDDETAATVLPQVFDAVRAVTPGEVARTAGWWTTRLADPPGWRDGRGMFHHVAYVLPEGGVDGYLSYRVNNRWNGALPASEVQIVDLQAGSPATYAALWRYALDMDLVRSVSAGACTDDEPIRWLLDDSRQLVSQERHDHLWVRILDLPCVLGTRLYPIDGRLVLEVTDTLVPDNAGRWELVVEGGGGHVGRTQDEPDLVLDISTLGSMCLGGVTPTSLAAGGRIEGADPRKVLLAELLLRPETSPRTTTSF